jgi:hypothetical protein
MARRDDHSTVGRFNETVTTISSAVRTALATIVIGGLAIGGYVGYSTYNAKELDANRVRKDLEDAKQLAAAKEAALVKATQEITLRDQQITNLNADLEVKKQEIQRLETSLTLLKVDHRLARLTVVDQGMDPKNDELYSDVEFVELNDEGEPIQSPRKFRIKGDVVFVDNWIVKFEDKYVEQADLERSTSLVLFRRIFGEMQQPKEGYPLDPIGERPAAYAAGRRETEFEKKIWADFWNIANDEKRAAEMGIRAAHGEAVSIRVQPGKSYRISLRASDGLSIVPEGAEK